MTKATTRARYTLEFKQETVRLVESGGRAARWAWSAGRRSTGSRPTGKASSKALTAKA